MSRLDDWLRTQRTILELDGTHCERIALEGPDGQTWARWPVKMENLLPAIEETIGALREELPKGRHPAKLIALSSADQVVSVLPQTLHGTSSAASNAISDQKALQQAVSIAIRNNEEQTIGLRAENDRLRERLAEAEDQRFELMEMVQKIIFSNHELQLKEQDQAKRHEMLMSLAEKAGPGIEVLGGALAQKGIELLTEWEKQAATKSRDAKKLRAEARKLERSNGDAKEKLDA